MSSPHATNTSTVDNLPRQDTFQHGPRSLADSPHNDGSEPMCHNYTWVIDDVSSMCHNYTWIKHDRVKLSKLREARTPWRDIADKLGKSEESCRNYYYERMENQVRRPWTKKDDIELIRLREARMSWVTIAKVTKRTKYRCEKHFISLGRNPPSTPSANPASSPRRHSYSEPLAANSDTASSASATAQLEIGTSKSSGMPRDAPNIELKKGEKVFDEDAISLRRNSEDLERLSRDALAWLSQSNVNQDPHQTPQDLGEELVQVRATIERNRTIRDGPEDDQREGVTTLNGLEPIRQPLKCSLSFICGKADLDDKAER